MSRFDALVFAAWLVGCGADHGESDKGPNADQFPTANVLWSFFSRHTR